MATVYTLEELSAKVDNIEVGVNMFFVFINGIIVFYMQAGFAFLEAGSVRAKNTNHILMKNILDTAISAVIFWMIGYAFLNGSDSNGFIGTSNFFLEGSDPVNQYTYTDFWYQFVYASAGTTIVSGAMAERSVVWSYALFSIAMTGVIYPISAHWAWNLGGWLNEVGFVDNSGSTVIHSVGGAGAFAGALIIGARLGRFGKNRKVIPIPGHSTSLLSMGFFTLWFGFLSFNGMAAEGIVGDFDQTVLPRAVINTLLAGAGGALSTLLVTKIGFGKTTEKVFGKEFKMYTLLGGNWSLTEACNGSLTGCVAMCAGCGDLNPWGGFVIGIGAGFMYCLIARIVLFIRVDDPLNAVAVHWGGGCWGTIFIAFIMPPDRVDIAMNGGIFWAWDGDAFKFWGVQMMGWATISLWSLFCCSIIFGIFRLLGILRVSKEDELKGLDNAHGEVAYAADPFEKGVADSDGMEDDASDPSDLDQE